MSLSCRRLIMASVRNKLVTGGGSSRHLNRFQKFAWISLGGRAQELGGCTALPSPAACAHAHSPQAGLAGAEEEGKDPTCFGNSCTCLFEGYALRLTKTELQWSLRTVTPSSSPFPSSAIVSIAQPSWLARHPLPHPGWTMGTLL